MPSGARKRKAAAAAKKKQGKFTPTVSSSTTSSTQGDEDLKHHESDGDHNTDGEEGVEKATEDVKNGDVQVEKEAGQDDGDVQVEEELKPDSGLDQKKGDSSSSDSSSDSDDGSREVEKKVMIVENAPVIDLVEVELPVPELHTEVSHTTTVTKLDDPVGECVSEVVGENIPALDEEVVLETGASAVSSISPDVVELGQEENEEAKLSSPVESAALPEVTKELEPEDQKESEVVENARVIDLVEAEHPVSELPVEVTHTTLVTILDDPVAECESELVGENILEPDEKVLLETGDSADNSTSSDVVELGQKENGDMKSSSPIESAILPEVTKELAAESQKDEENASLLEVAKDLSPEEKKNGNIDLAATSEAADPKNEEKLILSYNAPRVETTVDAEDVKESEVLGSVHSQACVTSSAQPNQATSWKSCCGLFEAFAGTSR